MNKFERLERLVGTSMVNSFKNEKIYKNLQNLLLKTPKINNFYLCVELI